jgi:CHAT domain-containing protein
MRKIANKGATTPNTMLACGVSQFGDRAWNPSFAQTAIASAVTRGSYTSRGTLADLPAVPKEVASLHTLFNDRIQIVEGNDAQESQVKEALKTPHRFLHFATHGLVDAVSPMQSAIALADPRKDPALKEGEEPTEDGFLTAREILDMRLNADLVFLSACQTALGKRLTGEGMIGLSWAFFVAGCPSLVASQWKVSDASTSVLVKEFYTQLLSGKTKAAALRAAQLKLLATRGQDHDYSHPYFWAPFILMGARD